MTLLILLPAPAWTRIIPSSLRLSQHRLLLERRLPAHKLQLLKLFFLLSLDVPREIQDRVLGLAAWLGRHSHCSPRLAILPAFFFLIRERQPWRTTFLHTLQEEQEPRRLVLDTVHHVLEHGERFLFVLH